MKKLMIAAAASIAAVGAFAAVESANVVGYKGVETEENRAPVIGAMFQPISGAETYDLRDCQIVGDAGEYCDPGTEFLRVLDPNSSVNLARYTYISREWMVDNFNDDTDEYINQFSWAIGWWVYDPSADYQALVEDDSDDTLKVKAAITINVGMAFLGSFSDGHSLRLVSSGSVPLASSGVTTEGNRAPMIANILPVDTTLFAMSISSAADDGEYCDPGTEFLRVLDPNSSVNAARYTYISRDWMVDNFNDDTDEYINQFSWAIGWWAYDPSADYQALIEDDKDDTLQLKADVDVPAGSGFLGSFSDGHSLSVNFPAAL